MKCLCEFNIQDLGLLSTWIEAPWIPLADMG